MLRLLDRFLPAVRLARDLAVTRERLACAETRNESLAHQHASLELRYNRLVESRLYRTGDISEPLSSPPSTSRPNVHGPMGTALGALFSPTATPRTAWTGPSAVLSDHEPVEEAPVA